VADRVYMLENAYYSVISPENCATIIYRDSGKAPETARALRLTPADLLELGLIDEIIPEPAEGAHTDPDQAAEFVRSTIRKGLDEVTPHSPSELMDQRYDKFRRMGSFFAEGQGA
jgi:acetyl-CoA carboxylase carboxyl transferase subunit alpha